jgi:hypothetical protein
MEEARRDLDRGALGDALDDQADAMEALREGMRSLGEALAQQNGPQGDGQQGDGFAGAPGAVRDPLGRPLGGDGAIVTDEQMLDGTMGAAGKRARELLEELRRRSGERDRPEDEREYLRRLLDRF